MAGVTNDTAWPRLDLAAYGTQSTGGTLPVSRVAC